MKTYLRIKILKHKPCSSCENYLKQHELGCKVCGTPLPEDAIQEIKKELKKKQRFVLQINFLYLSIYFLAGIILIKYLREGLPYVLAFLIIYTLIFIFTLTIYIYSRIKEKKAEGILSNRIFTIMVLLNIIITYGTMITFLVFFFVGIVFGIYYLIAYILLGIAYG